MLGRRSSEGRKYIKHHMVHACGRYLIISLQHDNVAQRGGRSPGEEVHLSLPNLHPTSGRGDLYVVAEADREPVREHGEHPLEVLLLRVGGEAKVV